MPEQTGQQDVFLDHEEVGGMLREHGITPTRQRVAIARVILARPQHVCADDLLARVNGAGEGVSKATIYNTLRLFADRGIVREVVVDPTRIFYDSNTSEHHHMYDLDTGRLSDIPGERIAVECRPDVPEGAVVEGVDVIVRVRSRSR